MSSTIRYSYETQCKDKRQYRRRRDAKAALARYVEPRTTDKGRLGMYKCPHCDTWHLGHSPK